MANHAFNLNLKTLARSFCLLVSVICLLVLAGWMFNVSILKTGIPNRPPMLLSSSAAFLLSSVSLLMLLADRDSERRRPIGKLLAWLAFGVAFFSASDTPHLRLGLENFIATLLPFKANEISHDLSIRGGLTLILFAIALLCFHTRRRFGQRAFQAAAILPILIALLALIGHAYNVGSFYGAAGLPLNTTVSFPSAIASVLFGAALLAARPELETTRLLVSKSVGGYVARRLLLAPVLIPLLTGFIHLLGLKTGHYNPLIANWLFSFGNILVFTVLIGWISFLLHKTDLRRLQAEETVRELNEGLEEQVRQRTNELTETNLRLQREMDERKKTEQQLLRSQRVECLGALSGGIAHDLNNMLSPILMASELIAPELKCEDSRRYMDVISKSAQRGSDLIKQIMIFARGAKGEMQKIDLTLLLRDLQKTLDATLPRSITLRVEYAPGLPLVLGDPTQICQVLMNLCINARDAMPGGGTLQVNAEAIERPDAVETGRMIQVTVSDTGTGIPAENLAVIFEPFFTTKDPGKGTGLGLATVKKLVETHGGTIQVRSAIGKGAAFVVTFPTTSTEAPQLIPQAEDYQGHGERILIVEDELALREILKATLENAHYRVTAASNGIEALQAAQQNPAAFQLILTDFEMPFMTGRTLIDQLVVCQPSVPFVVMTGSLEMAGYEDVPKEGQWQLAKPFTTSALLKLVHQAVAQKSKAILN